MIISAKKGDKGPLNQAGIVCVGVCVGGGGRVRLDMVSNQSCGRVTISAAGRPGSLWDSVLNEAEKKGTQVKVWERQSHKQRHLGVLGGQSFPVEGLFSSF